MPQAEAPLPPPVVVRPGAPLGGGQRPSPLAPRRTLLYLVGAFLLFAFGFVDRTSAPVSAFLERPARTAVALVEGSAELMLGLVDSGLRWSERSDVLAMAASQLVGVRQELERLSSASDEPDDAAAHADAARELGLRALVLKADVGGGDDLVLVDELAAYAAERRGDPALDALLRAHRAEHGVPESAPAGPPTDAELAAARELAGTLSGDLLLADVLRTAGRDAEAERVDAARRARQKARWERCLTIGAIASAVFGLGALCALVFATVARRALRLARAELPPGDSTPLGFDLFARGLFAFQAISLALAALSHVVGLPAPLGLAGLLAWGPTAVLAARYVGRGPSDTARRFGLDLGPAALLRLVPVVLAVATVAVAGWLLLTLVTGGGAIGRDWTTIAAERWLFGSTFQRAGLALEALAWAPLFEELAFRGLLFGALRSRMSFTGAALSSSLLFAAMHPYGVAALVPLTWLGLVLCWTYERTRSLWPCMLVHLVHNALSFAFLSVLRP